MLQVVFATSKLIAVQYDCRLEPVGWLYRTGPEFRQQSCPATPPHASTMTTQACNLQGRVPAGPIYVQRQDGTAYCEADETEIARMIAAGIVEGLGPSSGIIKRLRMICTEVEGIERMAAIPLPKRVQETPGSIMSMASKEVFKEHLGESGLWCYTLLRNRNISLECRA